MERKPFDPDEIWDGSTEPALELRVGAALFILALGGPQQVGLGTVAKLMWPYKPYYVTDDNGLLRMELAGTTSADGADGEIRRMAAKTLASALTALISALPPAQIVQIEKVLGEYLSFACGDG